MTLFADSDGLLCPALLVVLFFVALAIRKMIWQAASNEVVREVGKRAAFGFFTRLLK